MNRSFLVFLILIIAVSSLYPKDNDKPEGILGKFVYDIEQSWEDLGNIGGLLVNCYPRTLYSTGAVVGSTMLGMTLDDEVRSVILRNQNESAHDFFKSATHWGDRNNVIIFSSSLYLGSLFLGLDDVRHTSRLLLESMLMSGIITGSLKVIIGRSRPYKGNGNSDYRFFQSDDGFHSLPSGHSTIAFTIATVLAFEIDTWWSYAGFYSLAGLVAGSRLYLDLHWISDVIAGSMIGTLSSLLVLEADRCTNSDVGSKFVFYPTLNGFGLSYSF